MVGPWCLCSSAWVTRCGLWGLPTRTWFGCECAELHASVCHVSLLALLWSTHHSSTRLHSAARMHSTRAETVSACVTWRRLTRGGCLRGKAASCAHTLWFMRSPLVTWCAATLYIGVPAGTQHGLCGVSVVVEGAYVMT
jgi:hypothetical protein